MRDKQRQNETICRQLLRFGNLEAAYQHADDPILKHMYLVLLVMKELSCQAAARKEAA